MGLVRFSIWGFGVFRARIRVLILGSEVLGLGFRGGWRLLSWAAGVSTSVGLW